MKILLNRYFNTSQIKLFSFILISVMLCGCSTIKPSSNKSGKNYYETFYVGEEGTQYYIKPLLFKKEKSDEELILDITFRYKNEIKDSAVVNFSVIGSIIHKSIDSVILSNKNIEIKSTKVELLFNEKNKAGFKSRFSTKFTLKDVYELFRNDEWEFILYDQEKITKYRSQKKTNKTITTLRDRVFIIM